MAARDAPTPSPPVVALIASSLLARLLLPVIAVRRARVVYGDRFSGLQPGASFVSGRGVSRAVLSVLHRAARAVGDAAHILWLLISSSAVCFDVLGVLASPPLLYSDRLTAFIERGAARQDGPATPETARYVALVATHAVRRSVRGDLALLALVFDGPLLALLFYALSSHVLQAASPFVTLFYLAAASHIAGFVSLLLPFYTLNIVACAALASSPPSPTGEAMESARAHLQRSSFAFRCIAFRLPAGFIDACVRAYACGCVDVLPFITAAAKAAEGTQPASDSDEEVDGVSPLSAALAAAAAIASSRSHSENALSAAGGGPQGRVPPSQKEEAVVALSFERPADGGGAGSMTAGSATAGVADRATAGRGAKVALDWGVSAGPAPAAGAGADRELPAVKAALDYHRAP